MGDLKGMEETAPAGRLLVVDDEPSILATLVRMFRPQGYLVHTAGSGKEGLQVLEREQIDVVISDMRMPEMDGADFLAQVTDRWPEVTCILLTGHSDMESTARAIGNARIFAYFDKPWDRKQLLVSVAKGLEFRQRKLLEKQSLNPAHAGNAEKPILQDEREITGGEFFSDRAPDSDGYTQVKRAYFDAVNMFAQIMDRFEQARTGHSRRVAHWAVAVAERLGLGEGSICNIRTAALLHDIGKIGLAESLRKKSQAELMDKERVRLRMHPVEGQAILMTLEPLQEAARMIRHHHERFDGKGYPDRLQGDMIPLGARIINVCDAFDQLTQGYHNGIPMTANEALVSLREERGTLHDPSVVDAFIALMDTDTESEESSSDRACSTDSIQPGMRLARTLFSQRHVPLVVAGNELTHDLINKLRSYEHDSGERLVVYI